MASFILSSKAKSNTQENTKHLLHIVIICILLAAAIISIYWQVIRFEFIELDDPQYIANNFVKQGISFDGIRWAFSAVYASNWHPLTWISHMLDIQLFGMNPGMHHLTNTIFHILNTIFLFLLFERMTGALWRSAVIAALFALHPVHVESVVWISERKDVLSTFFWMLTIMGYVWYIQKRNVPRYLVVVLFYILGLLSKPMLVTLPFVLLLLDYWPLNQLKIDQKGDSNSGHITSAMRYSSRGPNLSILLLEKIPLIVFALISCGVTLFAQRSGGAIRTFAEIGLGVRIVNAVNSYIFYLGKALCPVYLSIFYPYPHTFHLLWIISCVLLLLFISTFVLFYVSKFPYLLVGWLWYLGTLIPVIGIVQIGDQSIADRYTYIPLIGIFLMIVWGLGDFFSKCHYRKYFLKIILPIVSIILIVASWSQIGFWKNNQTLFRHALAVTENNYLAHGILGVDLINHGNVDGAIKEYQKAIEINPNYYLGYFRLGQALSVKKEYGKAIDYYLKGLEIKPDDILALNYLGDLLAKIGKTDEAINRYNDSLRIDPHQPLVYNNLGNTYMLKGNAEKAIKYYQYAINVKHNYSEAIKNLKNARIIQRIQELLKADPQNIILYAKLGDLYSQVGGYDEAIAQYQKAILIEPKFIHAMSGLVLIYSNRHAYTKALDVLMSMQKIQPGNPEVTYNIACIYSKQNKPDESIIWLKQALEDGFHNWDLLKNDPDLTNIRNTSYLNELIKNH